MPQMTAHQQIRFWDPFTDAEAVRISGFSGRGEYWVKRPAAPAGRARRAQMDAALTLIAEAIEAGLEPGEVVAD